MKPLLVVSTHSKKDICGSLWDGVGETLPLEWRVVHKDRDVLSAVLPLVAGHDYSRVVIDANLRRFGPAVKQLRGLPRLVLFDHDVCQELVPYSDWYHRYVPVMKYLQVSRVIVSSAFLARYLGEQGIDAVCIAKAFDCSVIHDLGGPRDLAAAFVGRTTHRVYRRRKRMLQRLHAQCDVPVMRSEPGAPYNALLNRIGVFISADVGFNEYMIKNFEAMAAGCTLLAWRQPDSEQTLLGFREGEHGFLYDSFEELKQTLAMLKNDPALARRVAAAGRELVVSRHQWTHRVAPMVDALVRDVFPMNTTLSPLERWRLWRL